MRLVFFIVALLLLTKVFAVCPVCTFAVGAGIGLAQYFGIDDTVTAIWIGGFTISLIIWTKSWLEKKNLNFYGLTPLLYLFFYGSIIGPLYLTKIIGHELNKLWGLDKILLGMFIGSVTFYSGVVGYEKLKKHHNDRAYFPFQKVVMPVAPLIILSVIFYYLTK